MVTQIPSDLAFGSHTIVLTAEAADGSVANISLPVNIEASTIPPAFTSGTSDTVPAGTAFTYPVTTTGSPTPAVTLASGSTLPTGVTLTDNGNSTATLAGTSSVAAGVYNFTIQAANGVSPNATQAFTLTVTKPPAFTSGTSDTVPAGTAFTYPVTTTGSPTPAVTLASGSTLPTGVTLTDNGNSTATLAGTSSVAAGVYNFTIQAANGVSPNATQAFTLTVTKPPAFTSGTSDTVPAGTAFTYPVTTTGSPTPAVTLASGSTLPTGVTLTDNGNSTATLAGTSSVAAGVYNFTIQAANGVSPNATQAFTLTVTQISAQVSLKFTGAITYTNSGSQTSGGFTITPATGTISSVTGAGTIPGLKGGSTTIKVNVQRIWLWLFGFRQIDVGYIQVVDPGANLNSTALVLTPILTRVGTKGVSGVAYGLAPNSKQIICTLNWTL